MELCSEQAPPRIKHNPCVLIPRQKGHSCRASSSAVLCAGHLVPMRISTQTGSQTHPHLRTARQINLTSQNNSQVFKISSILQKTREQERKHQERTHTCHHFYQQSQHPGVREAIHSRLVQRHLSTQLYHPLRHSHTSQLPSLACAF
ncbi:hypothetical protein DR999_PMT23257 [Platysternon megacephalum]|uniref:Uncharacterized protein n=1 Tax=Platysternon megacephalum TaxID=55544 RepID=A0A4D9DCF8_9SAUR|nr:hypothetical protein DR999_PMT23257 [Platysternon megacephalum]